MSFPGAGMKQVKYYIEEILNEESIERIIINIGTNNLPYQNQTENEIMMEIIEIVKKCHHYGDLRSRSNDKTTTSNTN